VLVLAGLVFWVGAAVLETVRARAASPRSSDDGPTSALRPPSRSSGEVSPEFAGRSPTTADATAGKRSTMDDQRWRPAALIAAGMALDLALMEQAGFVLASTALFWLTARAFDRQRPGRDALYALAVSAGAYLLFVRVLNVTLPAGFVARWF
jgi:hypothetical protein